MVISLIHPSRGRPRIASDIAIKWIKNAGVDVEYILSVDDDEPTNSGIGSSEYITWFNIIVNNYKYISNKNRSAIDAINNAANISTGDIIVVMSDDFDCHPQWGKKIIETTQGKKDWIAKTPDGIQKWIITLPIMDRAYYNRFGYVYYTEYQHLFCDTEMTCVADLTGRKINLNIPFTHNHYSTGKTQKDAINERADKTWAQGEKLFIERYKKNFDLVNPVGKITSPEYLSWIKSKI